MSGPQKLPMPLAVPEPANPQVIERIDFDPHGDVILVLNTDTLQSQFQVNSSVLCLASPVFRAMLGVSSRFQEASRLAVARTTGTPMELILGDDNAIAMERVLWAIHSRCDKVPRTLTELELYEIAVVVDKYDMIRAISVWPEHVWIPPLKAETLAGYGDRWLYMSYVFGLKDLFRALTGRFISMDKNPLEVKPTGNGNESPEYSITEHVPQRILDAIEEERALRNIRALELTHELLNAYLLPRDLSLCEKGWGKTCDTVILGHIIKTLLNCSLFPLPDLAIHSTQFNFAMIQQFINEFKVPAFFLTDDKARQWYNNQYQYLFPVTSSHAEACSPMPEFRQKIQENYGPSPGLDYDLFVPKKANGA